MIFHLGNSNLFILLLFYLEKFEDNATCLFEKEIPLSINAHNTGALWYHTDRKSLPVPDFRLLKCLNLCLAWCTSLFYTQSCLLLWKLQSIDFLPWGNYDHLCIYYSIVLIKIVMPPLNNTPGTNHDYKKVEMIIKMSLNHIITLLAGPWQT